MKFLKDIDPDSWVYIMVIVLILCGVLKDGGCTINVKLNSTTQAGKQ